MVINDSRSRMDVRSRSVSDCDIDDGDADDLVDRRALFQAMVGLELESATTSRVVANILICSWRRRLRLLTVVSVPRWEGGQEALPIRFFIVSVLCDVFIGTETTKNDFFDGFDLAMAAEDGNQKERTMTKKLVRRNRTLGGRRQTE